VLRRAKRQQDLIVQVQKSLKVLVNLDKSVGKTMAEIKQLQSAVKDTQKQIVQIERQIATIKKAQERNYLRLAKEKKRSVASKRAKASARGRKIKSK
jgi:predicted  nucleic acid-binding Zn-ribbon protein